MILKTTMKALEIICKTISTAAGNSLPNDFHKYDQHFSHIQSIWNFAFEQPLVDDALNVSQLNEKTKKHHTKQLANDKPLKEKRTNKKTHQILHIHVCVIINYTTTTVLWRARQDIALALEHSRLVKCIQFNLFCCELFQLLQQ